jgi:hypothetical protein
MPCVPEYGERSTPVSNAAGSAVTMFPNPAAQTIFIQSAQNEQGHEFILTNLLGQIVLTRSLDGNQTEVLIGHLKPGVYFAQLFSNGQRKTLGKLMIAR